MTEFTGIWETLLTMQQMHAHGKAAHMLRMYGNTALDGDYIYEMAWEALTGIFADTRVYYNEEQEIETVVLFDPALNDFYLLCEQYEKQNAVTPEENRYRKDLRTALERSLTIYDYCYDYRFTTDPHTKNGCRIVLLFSCEFCSNYEIPGALLEALDAIEYYTKQLQDAMEDNVIPFPDSHELKKEAA